MRLFISIDQPIELRQQISQLMAQFDSTELSDHSELKATRCDQLHLTLAFPGEQPLNNLERIEQALDSLTIPRLTLNCAGIGHFNSGVLWLKVTPDPALLNLQTQLCHRLREAGIKLEERKYIPHITLFRHNERHRQSSLGLVQQKLDALFQYQTFSFELDAIWLKRSYLNETGACHEIISGFH
ncbi:MAG: RNA 2',3'-cyclic phosphodiesterase [Marinobacterium sp.]|nr:RNA 2',3'-cyclic phosphodiesterase [Marinobacterium sp.]